MRGESKLFKGIGLVLIVLLALSVWSIASAQSDTTQTTEKPYLGINIGEDEAGAKVLQIVPGSPADEAGLEAGDIITAVGDTTVTSDTLAETLQGYAVGDKVDLSALRGSEQLDLTATLGARPAEDEFMPPMLRGMERPYLGVTLADTDSGVVIREVTADSPAAEAGLQAEDQITAINGEEVTAVRQAAEIISALQSGDKVTLDIVRGGEKMSLEATLGSAPDNMMPGFRGQFGDGSNFGLSFDGEKLTIERLSEDHPLYAAGLREGDVITAIDGEKLELGNLMQILPGLVGKDTVKVTVERDGKTQELDVPADALNLLGGMQFNFGSGRRGDRGDNLPFQMPFDMGQMMNQGYLGVGFITLNTESASQNNVDVTEGALISEVQANSPAEKAGLQKNDIITAVNGEVVDEERTLSDRLYAYEAGDTVTLDVLRDGKTIQIEATLAERDFMSELMPMFGGRDGGFQFEFPAPQQEAPAGRQL